MNKYKVVALVGESGTGKSTLSIKTTELYQNIFHRVVTSTTRPPREGEINGQDYFFLSDKEMLEKIYNGEIIEAANFNGWVYGTSILALDKNKINIGVWNPAGVITLYNTPELIDLLVIRLITPEKERLLRALNREKNPNVREIIRRFQADIKDFEKFENNFEGTYIELYNDKEIELIQLIEEIKEISLKYFGQN